MRELSELNDDGAFHRTDVLAHGYTDRDITRALRSGELTRVRQGAYIATDRWEGADPLVRHHIRSCAVLRTHTGRVALSHTSAAVEHGLRLYDPGLDRVHVTRLDGGSGGRTREVVYHAGACDEGSLATTNGRLCVTPARAALETASLHDVQSGLVTLDSALNLGLATWADLASLYERRSRWPHSRRLQVTLRLARPGAESVGESRMRYLCWSQGVPEPVLQYPVRDRAGHLVGRCDMAWPDHGVLGEFDGRVKYTTLRTAGESPEDVVYREKVREDALREAAGFRVIRFVWGDLHRPATTAARIRAMLHGASATSA